MYTFYSLADGHSTPRARWSGRGPDMVPLDIRLELACVQGVEIYGQSPNYRMCVYILSISSVQEDTALASKGRITTTRFIKRPDPTSDSLLLSSSPFNHVHQVQYRRPRRRRWPCWAHVCEWVGTGGSERANSRPEVSAGGGQRHGPSFDPCKSSLGPS